MKAFKSKNEEKHEFEASDANSRGISMKERQILIIHYQLLLGTFSWLCHQQDGEPQELLGEKGIHSSLPDLWQGSRSDFPNTFTQKSHLS